MHLRLCMVAAIPNLRQNAGKAIGRDLLMTMDLIGILPMPHRPWDKNANGVLRLPAFREGLQQFQAAFRIEAEVSPFYLHVMRVRRRDLERSERQISRLEADVDIGEPAVVCRISA